MDSSCYIICEGHTRRQSSVDILSELDQTTLKPAEAPLQPKVLTASEMEEQQKEAEAVQEIANATGKDPYSDSESQQRLLSEFRQLEEQVQR